jgi:peptide chain release factor 2
MENFEIARHIENYRKRLSELKDAIKVDQLQKEIISDEQLTLKPDFYSDMNQAQIVLKRLKDHRDVIGTYQKCNDLVEELEMYFEIHKTEEDLTKEIETLIPKIETAISDFEIRMLLNKDYDHCNAIFELHPGAGGTESQDWTEILFRMYRRYAERHGYGFEILDYQSGEEAGIKSVSFMVSGENAYGYLKGEQGVHRLIRISPFDSNSRRHTSFCACTVTPEVDSKIDIEIKPEDVRVDTYRSSGAGGQNVNKVETAIRITHLKTGIVVTCQNERSQLQNRERAFAILASKLYMLEKEAQENKIKSLVGESLDNSFGSQIRTYTFHPYSLIKDHRTDYEVGNVTPVMDGDIDGFINAYLKSEYNVR